MLKPERIPKKSYNKHLQTQKTSPLSNRRSERPAERKSAQSKVTEI